MPILEIEIVTDNGESLKGKAQQLADAAGEVLGSPAGRTWVRLRALPRNRYAENHGGSRDVRPVFVSVLKSRCCSTTELKVEAARLCRAVANVCGRPKEYVHVLYLPEAADRMAFGGNFRSIRADPRM